MARLKKDRTKKENSIVTIGDRLRKAREVRGVSIEEVHKATKIHPKVLQALEDDNLEKTLDTAYVRAFLKGYAHHLGLDGKSILQEYASKMPSIECEKSIITPEPCVLRKGRKVNHAVVIALTIIAWILMLSFATMKFFNSYKPFAKKKKTASSARSEPRAAENAAALIPIPKSRTILLTITASDDVWLKITRDGEVSFQGILSKNSKETWQADKEIMLTEIGRPDSLSLEVNGKHVDFSGKRLGRSALISHKGIDLEPR